MATNQAFVGDEVTTGLELTDIPLGQDMSMSGQDSLPVPPPPMESVVTKETLPLYQKIVSTNGNVETTLHHVDYTADEKISGDEQSRNGDALFTDVNDDIIVAIGNGKPEKYTEKKKKQNTFDDDDGEVDDESEYDWDEESDAENMNAVTRKLKSLNNSLTESASRAFKVVSPYLKYLFLVLFFCYFGYAMYYEFGTEPSMRLLVFTALGTVIIVHSFVGGHINRALDAHKESKACVYGKRFSKWFLYLAMTAFAVFYVVVEIGMKKPSNLSSLAGLFGYILLACILSNKVSKAQWRTVFWGASIQFILAIVVLRTTWGVQGITWLSDRVNELLEYGYEASVYVFGSSYGEHRFVFKSLPLIFLINSFITVLYHIGVMGWIVRTFGRFLSFALDCSPAESMSVVANIFLGSTQAALAVKPFLASMSSSEVFALMVGGFSSVSTTTIGLYIQVGAKAEHVITACILSAPAALAMAKIIVPEKRKRSLDQAFKVEFVKYSNILEAAATGAMDSIRVFASVLINLYTFYALLRFVNATLVWFGGRVGLINFGFQYICSYILFPLPLLMGIELADCRGMAKVIAVKLTTSNLVGFTYLGDFIKNTEVFTEYTANPNNTWHYVNDDIVLDGLNKTLVDGILSPRTTAIGTFALCGFSNFVSIGISLGTYLALIPKKKNFITKIVIKGMIAGNFACYMTACIAGLFYEDSFN